jgi:hypothetical protein
MKEKDGKFIVCADELVKNYNEYTRYVADYAKRLHSDNFVDGLLSNNLNDIVKKSDSIIECANGINGDFREEIAKEIEKIDKSIEDFPERISPGD